MLPKKACRCYRRRRKKYNKSWAEFLLTSVNNLIRPVDRTRDDSAWAAWHVHHLALVEKSVTHTRESEGNWSGIHVSLRWRLNVRRYQENTRCQAWHTSQLLKKDHSPKSFPINKCMYSSKKAFSSEGLKYMSVQFALLNHSITDHYWWADPTDSALLTPSFQSFYKR